jgi:3',5'-cyclic AMP phosphodiesterase CpdA
MEFSFEARVVLTLEHKEGMPSSKHKATNFNLFVFGDLDERVYLKDDLPTQEGSAVLSTVLVQGLVGNIHAAHQSGFRDSAEHLRWIIAELEKGFAAVAEVRESNFK